MVAVELSLAESPNLIISVFYRPPNNNSSFIDEFDTFLSNTSGLPKTKLLLLGDFNFPNICWLENDVSLTSDESAFCEILKDHFLQQVNFSPTRVSTMTLTANILDLIITNEPDSIANVEVIQQMPFPSDHFPVSFDFTTHLPGLQKKPRTVYNLKNVDFVALKHSLAQAQLSDIIDEHSTIEVAYTDWINKLMEIIDSHIPKTKLRDINTPPWINGPVMHLVRKKNEARKKAITTNSTYYREKYQSLRRQCKSLIRSNYQEYIDSLNMSMRKNPKRFWSFYKNKKKSPSIPTTVKFCNQTYRSAPDQAEAFNTYFHSVFSLDATSIPHLHEVQQTCDLTASDSYTSSLQLEVSVEEVEKLLREIDPTKACGPDAFPSLVLKECASELAPSACKLFNKSISSGTFPQQWKEAVVVPA